MEPKEIETKYSKLLKDVETNDFYKIDLTNRVNCYKCPECDIITKTIDIDAGVTPSMHRCEVCGGFANSTFYRDIAPHQKPTQEWYRPTFEQVKKMKNPRMIEHILMGGLDNRKIKTEITNH